mmetsp:Transcript_4254/g.7729  ORF Transcript_4254/g.7729 Transcript_4254/m.7729 type:complete len:425 (-) Transcript_4254:33-1307(-)
MASGPAWSWPPWCLNHRDGQIEVFVNDEESGTARWVPGMAQTRIVDPNGQDAYLQVLYVWDGEEYVEDFAPPQVRAVGSAQTVEDLIRTGEIQSTRSLRETPAPADTSQQLAEVVLECVEADGVDPSKVPKEERALAFKVKPGDPAFLYCKIGRQHQPEFFERMVPVKENLTSISRTHFELNYEDDGSNPCPKIRQLSRNKLLVDSRLVTWTEARPLPVPDGTRLTFCGSGDSDTRFLVLRVTLRSRATVSESGPHPAVVATMQQKASSGTLPVTMSMGAPMKSVAAVLECVRTAGADLSKVPANVKAIPLSHGPPVEIGRSHQSQIFDSLLQAEPKYLSFVSRAHCRVHLEVDSSAERPALALHIENLSMNVLFVAGSPLAKGEKTSIYEGGTVTFAAAVTGDEDTKFLEFMFRRAKLVGAHV